MEKPRMTGDEPYPNRLERCEYETDSDDESDVTEDEYDSNVEAWCDIDGYDNYLVSTFGNVYNCQTGRILKLRFNGNYQHVDLCKNGKNKTMKIHRLVAEAFIDNPDNKMCVDHVNNDKTNNHVSNLRWATHSENNMNAGKQKNNTSGVIGVNWDKRTKKWQSYIYINGKKKHFGYFKTLEQAKQARIKAVKKYFGDYAHSSKKC
jgi:hypothetical protein